MTEIIGFIDGVNFDIFFRGLLSTIAMFIVLCGATYMIIATNTGVRQGFLIAGAGFFGWMLLMGIIWSIYGTGWIGEAQSWRLLEINNGDLAVAETDGASDLAGVNLATGVSSTDPDAAQTEALEVANNTELSGWLYLPTSDATRGEAQSSVDEFLLDEGFYDSPADYVPLAFGAFTIGGKPRIEADAALVDRFTHWFDESVLTPLHPQELILVQVQGAREQFALDGTAPPTAEIDPNKEVVSVIMERDRGGPLPSVVSGVRFTPFLFTLINGLIFAIFAAMLHSRTKRQEEAVAAAA